MTDRNKPRAAQGSPAASGAAPKAETRDASPTPGRTWGGRFAKATDPTLQRFSSSVHFDRRLWRQDIRGSIAHARMLGAQGILDAHESQTLIEALERVAGEFERGEIRFDPALEDIHTHVEQRLTEQIGALAGKLHSGRSRNDQVATDLLLWMRDETRTLRAGLLELREVLVERAEREVGILLPGYTHLQRAQPVRLAHHWLAHFEALSRDDARLADACKRMDRSPLGSGALAATTLPLDREATARELGFVGPTRNSLDAVAARDAALELVSGLAILMIHLSRLCEELVLWSSSEFGFIEMDDAFSTGSSLMPQKKNPDVPELVRGKSGRVIGSLVSLLVTLKGLPLSYNRDMQEDKEPVFDAVDTTRDCVEILAGALRTLRVNAPAMEAAARDPQLLATDLAEYLVQRGRPFREAHTQVGRVVAFAREAGLTLAELSREQLLEIDPQLDIEPKTFFVTERSVEARSIPGGPACEAVGQALIEARVRLEETRRTLGEAAS